MAVLIGTNGNDDIEGTLRSDSISGRGGDDDLSGLARSDAIKGGSGNDDIDGGLGNDFLRGGAGDDDLKGGFGRDLLVGGIGDDTLDGGPGSDVMRGGFGSDTFVLRAFGDPLAPVALASAVEDPHECPPVDHECPYPEPREPSQDVDVVLDFEWRTDAIAVQPGRVADIVAGDFDGDGDLDATLILDDGSRTIFLQATTDQVQAAIVEEPALI